MLQGFSRDGLDLTCFETNVATKSSLLRGMPNLVCRVFDDVLWNFVRFRRPVMMHGRHRHGLLTRITVLVECDCHVRSNADRC